MARITLLIVFVIAAMSSEVACATASRAVPLTGLSRIYIQEIHGRDGQEVRGWDRNLPWPPREGIDLKPSIETGLRANGVRIATTPAEADAILTATIEVTITVDGDGSTPDDAIYTFTLTSTADTVLWKRKLTFAQRKTPHDDDAHAVELLVEKLSRALRPFAGPSVIASGAAPSAKALHCGYGGIGMVPLTPPPGFEREFAVAVVEINSPRELRDVTVSAFALIDKDGRSTLPTRMIGVEDFQRPRTPTEGSSAYYENPGGTVPWEGTLPAGNIRLRVRVAMPNTYPPPVRFRLRVGPFYIEGPPEGCTGWPTGAG